MERRDLDFMCAFAEMHNMMNKPLNEVYTAVCNYANSLTGQYDDGSVDFEVARDIFMDRYNSVEEYHMDYEIKESMASGMSFLEACEDWDV